MPFTGEFSYTLDAKNRLIVPGRIREGLDVQRDGDGWYLVPGFDGTISIFTPTRFEEVVGNQQADLFRLKDIRDYDRLRFALSARVEMDRLGRILIPEIMLRRTAIGKEVAIIGVRDHLEIWDRVKWEEFVAKTFGAYDQLAQSAYDAARQDRQDSPGGPRSGPAQSS